MFVMLMAHNNKYKPYRVLLPDGYGVIKQNFEGYAIFIAHIEVNFRIHDK